MNRTSRRGNGRHVDRRSARSIQLIKMSATASEKFVFGVCSRHESVRYSGGLARPSMTQMNATFLPTLIRNHESRILSDWMAAQLQSVTTRRDLMNEDELRRESREFLSAFSRAAESSGFNDLSTGSWTPVRELLARVSLPVELRHSRLRGSASRHARRRRPCIRRRRRASGR